VEKLGDSWLEQVRALYTKGSTALGPALAAGVFVFLARKASGRILLLTDGLANVGFGRLEGDGAREGRAFYENMAKLCLKSNIVGLRRTTTWTDTNAVAPRVAFIGCGWSSNCRHRVRMFLETQDPSWRWAESLWERCWVSGGGSKIGW
jgi:hypothetical protein